MPVRLITGCSSGFGEAIALGFADRGDTVLATMRRPEVAPKTLRSHENISIMALDVTSAESRRNALDETLRRHGRIDTLVNNAGALVRASVEDTPEDMSRLIFETNYFGPVELMRAVPPVMRDQGGGRIVSITAIGAILSSPLLGVYCASKHALDCAAAVIDIEGQPFGVRAPAVLPGQFKTPLLQSAQGGVSEPYASIADALDQVRVNTAADVLTDLGPVVDAVLAASLDAEPKARYLVGVGLAEKLLPALDELALLHELCARRAGVD